MTKRDKFISLCHEVTCFCYEHAGKCFGGWSRETIIIYVSFLAMAGCVFVKRSHGAIKSVAFAFPENSERLQKRFAAGDSAFKWKLPKDADCILVSEVISDRSTCADFAKQAARQWPALRRVFTFRRVPDLTLVELKPQLLTRFYGFEIKEAA